MNKSKILLGFKRGVAYLIDCLVILLYAILLFAVTMSINKIWPFYHFLENSYALRHALSFLTLTLPGLLYFVLMEYSKNRASLGKIIMKLKVVQKDEKEPELMNLLIRNVIKLLPWEISHLTYQLNPDFFITGEITNPGIIIGLSFSYGLLYIYIGMVFLRNDGRGGHEFLSDTFVVNKYSQNYAL